LDLPFGILPQQQIFPNKQPGGEISFVAFAFVLGIIFSIVAYNTIQKFY
jgi:hypothetical protein